MRNKALTLICLSAVPFIMVLGNSMLIPVLPQMKEALNVSQFKVSLAITLFSIPAGLTIPFAGFFSDRTNRKIIIAVALGIYGLGGVLAGVAELILKSHAYYLIMGGRILQGVGAAGTAPIAMALAGDIFTSNERSKVLGLLEATNGLGKVTSPILGSLLGLVAWWAVFFLFPVLCIPVALGILFFVQEPASGKQPKPFKQYLQTLGSIFKQKGVSLVSAFLAGSTVLFILFGVLFYLSDHLETKYKIEGVLKGLILAVPVLAMSATSYLTGVFTQKKIGAQKPLVIAGLVLQAGSLAVVPFFQGNTYVLVAALVFAGVGTGLVLPCLNTLITSSCHTEERGIITALYGGVRFFGVAGGPPLFGYLMEKSTLWMFLVPAILAGCAGLVDLILLKPEVMNKAQQKSAAPQARAMVAPQFRPLDSKEMKERLLKKSLEKLTPQIKKAVEKEISKELNSMKEQLLLEVDRELRNSLTLEIKKEDDKKDE